MLHASKQQESPLLQDEQFAVDVNRMLAKYHKLGMGTAIQLLSSHRDILSLPEDLYYDVYVRFIRGDFYWLLTTDTMSCRHKAAYALFIRSGIQLEHSTTIRYMERFLAGSPMLSPDWLIDLRLNLLFLYLKENRLEEVREQLDAIRQGVADLDSPSFTAIFLMKEMYLQLQEGYLEAASIKLQQCEMMLAKHPLQRERGALLVAKAMFLYRQGSGNSARLTLDEGIETIRRTHFIPHLIANLNTSLLYLGKYAHDDTYRLKYRKQWDQLAEQLRFGDLLIKTEQTLENIL